MDLENVGTKIFDFFFDFNFDDFDFLLLLLKVTKVGDLSCVLVGPPRSGKGTYKFMLVS